MESNLKKNQALLSDSDFIKEYKVRILELQEQMRKEKQIEMPLVHEFSDGVYMRTIFMEKDIWVIGKTHKTEHFNIIHTGSCNLMIDGVISYVKAPYMFVSGKGVKKVLRIIEDMTWSTVHPINNDDLIKEDGLIDVEKTSKKLEPFLVCDRLEELKLVETEIRGLL